MSSVPRDSQALPTDKVRVWDLPTRVFHWVLALAVIGLVISAKIGGNAMEWHFRLGYAVFTLMLFRLIWGFTGGYWSRFARFLYSPAGVRRYLRGASRPDEFHDVGHNPLGSFSVYGLLVLLVAQVGTGLFADDEIAASGPLAHFVSSDTSGLLSDWHTQWGQWLVIGLACLHVLAVLFYVFVKRKTLVRPMITGNKKLAASVPPSVDNARSRSMALLLLVACAAVAAWVASLRA